MFLSRCGSLFPLFTSDPFFLMAQLMWLVLVNVLLCCSFSLLHGDSGALSFHIPFSYLPQEDCISGHCKLVFLLWSGHSGASTAHLKFCLTILRSSSTPSYPCAISALLAVRVLIYLSFSIHSWSHQTLDQPLERPSSPPGFVGLGFSFNPCSTVIPLYIHPALLYASSCVNPKLNFLAFSLFYSLHLQLFVLLMQVPRNGVLCGFI